MFIYGAGKQNKAYDKAMEELNKDSENGTIGHWKTKRVGTKAFEYARNQITGLGYIITEETATALKFEYKGSIVTIYPYSGWHTGKTIKDGRGTEKLINQIKKKTPGSVGRIPGA